MPKSAYVFEYRVSAPEHLKGEVFKHTVRAMDEREAWRRFNRWVTDGIHVDGFEMESCSLLTPKPNQQSVEF